MQPDPILQDLVALVERLHADGRPALQLRLMVNVGSMFVSGVLIPEEEFMSQQKPLLQALHQIQTDAAQRAAVSLGSPLHNLSEIAPEFLHLARVSFSGPTGEWDPPADESGEFWRARLSSIDGFTLGESFERDPGR